MGDRNERSTGELEMDRSIANETRSGDQDPKTGPVAELITEPSVQSDTPDPKRKALVAGPKASRSAFMPAMSMEMALARRAAIVEFTRKIMVRDQDFGEIPGTSKPALLKPGAEKLCNFFGLEPEFTPVVDEIDWTGAQHAGETFCYLRYRCRLLRQGRILGVGEGSCNSWESRYRYIWVSTEYIREDLDRTQLLKRGDSGLFANSSLPSIAPTQPEFTRSPPSTGRNSKKPSPAAWPVG